MIVTNILNFFDRFLRGLHELGDGRCRPDSCERLHKDKKEVQLFKELKK